MAVVAYHACQWARIPFDIGAAGVDVFFVVSGFIMWRTTCGGEIAPLEFLRRRAIRIVPLYWAATLGLLIAALTFPSRFEAVDPNPWHVVASLAFIQHLNQEGLPFPLLPVGWTLNYEAVFYLLFAAALLLPAARRIWALTGVLLAMAVTGFIYPPAYIMLFNPLLLEFAAGMWLARLMGAGVYPARGGGWTLFAAGFGFFFMMQTGGIDWDRWRPLTWGFPALMVVAGLTAVERDGGLPSLAPLKSLGDASYSIYIIHTLAMGVFAMAFSVWNPLWVPLSIAIGAGSGWIVWKLAEAPVHAAMRSWGRPAATRLA